MKNKLGIWNLEPRTWNLELVPDYYRVTEMIVAKWDGSAVNNRHLLKYYEAIRHGLMKT